MARIRKDPDDRAAEILDAAVDLAKTRGFDRITRDEIAAECGVSTGLVSRYCGDMTELRHKVMSQAVREEVLVVIGQGIVARHPAALGAPERLRKQALAALV